MDSDALGMVLIMELEREIKQCEKAIVNKKILEDKELLKNVKELKSDCEDLLRLFNERNEAKGFRGKFKKKRSEAGIVKKVFKIRNKYKNHIGEINKIIGD